MLKEMIDAEQFDDWCLWNQWYPIDDQSNHHYPIAHLQATVLNMMRAKGEDEVSFRKCLLFGGEEPQEDLDQLLHKGGY